jgi:hypothetical protein
MVERYANERVDGEGLAIRCHALRLSMSASSSLSTNMYSQPASVLVSTLYLPASQLQFSVVCYLQWEAGETIVESWQGKQHEGETK